MNLALLALFTTTAFSTRATGIFIDRWIAANLILELIILGSAIAEWLGMAQLYPEATVGALVVNPKGEILLARSSKWHDKFTVPGGHIELGERAEDAIKREVKEETGLDVEPTELLLVQQAIYPKHYHKHEHYIFMDYVCRTTDTNVKLDGRELQTYVWVKPEDALALDMEDYTRNFVHKFLSRREKLSKPDYE